jgi:hypothetical protein
MRASFLTIILLAGSIPAVIQAAGQETDIPTEYPVMQLSPEILSDWEDDYLNNPTIGSSGTLLQTLESATFPESYSLLSRLEYVPDERDQGDAGNCWVWTGTGIMEVALSVETGVKDRLSIQYVDSNYSGANGLAGCGGNINYFAGFYNEQEIAIPWSNTNASYQDGSIDVCSVPSSVDAEDISTTPYYDLTGNMTAQTITTSGVDQAIAISNIKSVLTQNRAIYFAIYLPNGSSYTDWEDFRSFWNSQSESTVWSPNMGCGEAWSSVGGHAIVCVGYDDTDPSNPYWIMLNSWGANSGRPNGLFRLTQDLDYDCSFSYSGRTYTTYKWQTLSNIFNASDPTSVTTGAATEVTGSTAILNGHLSDLGDSSEAEVSFQWGTVSGSYDYETEPETLSSAGDFSATISGLESGRLYYFRAKATGNGTGSPTGYGQERSFSDIPVVNTETVSEVEATSGTLNGRLLSLGQDSSVTVSFEYGLTDSYGETTSGQAMTEEGTFSASVTGLTTGTTYHYRAKAAGSDPGDVAYGSDMTFIPNAPPESARRRIRRRLYWAVLNGS